jgi:hypothetical protein
MEQYIADAAFSQAPLMKRIIADMLGNATPTLFGGGRRSAFELQAEAGR